MRQKLPHLCNTKSTSLPLTLTIISAFLPALMKDRSSPIQSSVSTAPYTHQLLNPKKKFPPANRTLLMLHEQSSALHWSILIGTQSLVLCIKKNLLNILLSAILLYYHFTATLLEKVVCSLPIYILHFATVPLMLFLKKMLSNLKEENITLFDFGSHHLSQSLAKS